MSTLVHKQIRLYRYICFQIQIVKSRISSKMCTATCSLYFCLLRKSLRYSWQAMNKAQKDWMIVKMGKVFLLVDLNNFPFNFHSVVVVIVVRLFLRYYVGFLTLVHLCGNMSSPSFWFRTFLLAKSLISIFCTLLCFLFTGIKRWFVTFPLKTKKVMAYVVQYMSLLILTLTML